MKYFWSYKALSMLICTLCLFFFSSCVDTDSNSNMPNNEVGGLQLGMSTYKQPANTKLSSSKMMNSVFEEVTHVVVSLEQNGEPVEGWTERSVPLLTFGNSITSAPVEISSGSYQVTEYQIVNQENVIYAIPKIGSEKAYLVANPLAVTIDITVDTEHVFAPEVVTVKNATALDFGYESFIFDVVKSFYFFVKAELYNEVTNLYGATSAHVNVTSNSVTLFDQDIPSEIKDIWVRDVTTDYEVSVSLDGYPIWKTTVTPAELNDKLLLVNFGPVPNTIIDESAGTGTVNPVLVESENKLVVFYNETDSWSSFCNLKKAEYTGVSWSISTVMTDECIDKDGVVTDDNGAFHVGHFDVNSLDVSYSNNASGSWSTTALSGETGRRISIDLNQGNAHLAIIDYAAEKLNYATNSSGVFTSTTVCSSGCYGWPSIIANDIANPSILYFKGSSRDLLVSDASDWTSGDLIHNWSIDGYPYAPLKSRNGNRYTVYYYPITTPVVTNRILVATDESGAWVSTELEASMPQIFGGVDFAIDENEKLHIVIPKQDNTISYYSNRTDVWKSYDIMNDYNSDRVDTLLKNGRLYIVYLSTDNALKIISIDPMDYN